MTQAVIAGMEARSRGEAKDSGLYPDSVRQAEWLHGWETMDASIQRMLRDTREIVRGIANLSRSSSASNYALPNRY